MLLGRAGEHLIVQVPWISENLSVEETNLIEAVWAEVSG